MMLYFYFNGYMFQFYLISFIMVATIAIMIIVRRENHDIELLKKYMRQENDVEFNNYGNVSMVSQYSIS